LLLPSTHLPLLRPTPPKKIVRPTTLEEQESQEGKEEEEEEEAVPGTMWAGAASKNGLRRRQSSFGSTFPFEKEQGMQGMTASDAMGVQQEVLAVRPQSTGSRSQTPGV
jgi:hypothetical protein